MKFLVLALVALTSPAFVAETDILLNCLFVDTTVTSKPNSSKKTVVRLDCGGDISPVNYLTHQIEIY